MIIGVDFDNTIISYDAVFHSVALSEGLIPSTLGASKDNVRRYLREAGREDEWTRLQGYVYGVAISEAKPFDGARDFLCQCCEIGVKAMIISHKTPFPFSGPPWNLREAAMKWLNDNAFTGDKGILSSDDVFFETTKSYKMGRISLMRCTHFVDDLPEFLTEVTFPSDVKRILFDPNRIHGVICGIQSVTNWALATETILNKKP